MRALRWVFCTGGRVHDRLILFARHDVWEDLLSITLFGRSAVTGEEAAPQKQLVGCLSYSYQKQGRAGRHRTALLLTKKGT